ncbi:hypothetical protein ACROYT_G011041 [Oculina patagonica]
MFYLKYLDLSRNRISFIERHYFYSLYELSFLNLAYNPLREVEERAFFNTPKLKYLNLMFNSMDVLQPYHLSGPRDLVVELEPAKEVVNYHLPISVNLAYMRKSSGYQCNNYGNGSELCRPCPLGTYSGMQEDCTACPPGGFYQDEFAYTGRLSHGMGCKLCPLGHFVPPHAAPGKAITECILCPQGTEYARFAGFKGCECLSSFYRLDRFGPCVRCPLQGLTCQNESVRLQPGFFWKWLSNESLMKYEEFSADLLITDNSYQQLRFQGTIPLVYKCPAPEACLGGMRSMCSHGYGGPLCAVCSKGHYQLLNRCRKCPRMLWFVLQVCGIVILVVILTVSIFLGKKRKCASNRTVTDMILARLKIVIGFYQVTSGTLNTFSYVEWPSALLTVVHFANMVQLNLLEIVPLQCFDDNLTVNVYTRLLLVVGSNTAIIFLAAFIYQIRKLVLINTKKLAGPELAESLSSDKTQIYRVVSLLIFVTYPWTCTTIFSLLSPTCQQICSNADSCQYFLRADFSVQCFTDKYNKYVIAVYFLLILVVAIPIIVLFLLWKYHHRKIYEEAEAQNNKGREIANGLSFLYENYARQCWFWEIIELARKVWVTSTLFLMGADTRSHLGTAAIISGIYTILVAYYKPIRDTFEHWLQLVSLVANFITMNVGMLLKIPTEEDSSGSFGERDSAFVSAILVAVNVTVVALMAVHYMYTFITAVKHLRSKPKCGAECCVTFLMIMVGAGEDATDIDSGGIRTSAVSHDIN